MDLRPRRWRPATGRTEFGDNGRVLHDAVDGVSVATRRSTGVTDSQLELLRLMGLLDVSGGVARTTFPVMGPQLAGELRAGLASLVTAVADDITQDVLHIGAEPEEQGFAGRQFAVVFGDGLDGRLWDRLRETGRLPDTALDLDHPSWHGAFWAVYPRVPDAAGTNFFRVADAELVLVWTAASLPLGRVGTCARRHRLAPRRRHGAREPGRNGHDGQSPPVGAVRVGRSAARSGDRTRRPAGRTGRPDRGPGHRTRDGPLAEPLLRLLPTEDRHVATVVLAHELIWALTDELVARGAWRRQSVTASTTTSELRDVLFVYRP